MSSLTKKFQEKFYIIPILLFFFGIILCMFNPIQLHSSHANTGITNITESCFYVQEDGSLSNVDSYLESVHIKKGAQHILNLELPVHMSNHYSLTFTTVNCMVDVRYGKETIYETTLSSSDEYETIGKITHLVNIPVTYRGQTIDIILTPTSNIDVRLVSEVLCGDGHYLTLNVAQGSLHTLFVAMFIIFSGAFLFALGVGRISARHGGSFVYFGLFSIAYGLANLLRLDFITLVTENSILGYEIYLLSLAFLPYPIMEYMILQAGAPDTWRRRFLEVVPLLNFLFEIVALITKAVPLNYVWNITFYVIAFCIVVSLYYAIRHSVSVQIWKHPLPYLPYISYYVFLVVIIIEYIVYFFNQQKSFIMISDYLLLITNITFLVSFAMECKPLIEIGANSDQLKKAAYLDSLTGLCNRTALNQDMDKLESQLRPDSSIAIVQLDINYLKRTNDVLGHIAGDRLLKNAAAAIDEGFSSYGTCYRFGGDEFVVILKNNPKEKYNLGISAMESACERINRTLDPMEHVSIAYGIAYYIHGTDVGLWKVQERADTAMYERKRTMKERKKIKEHADNRL